MKFLKVIFLLVLVASCSPEKILNKKLDGEWSLISIDSKLVDSTFSKTIQFSRHKKGGDVIYTIVDNGQTTTRTGTYALIKTNSISVAFPNNAIGSGYETEVYDFTNSSKTDLTLTQQGYGNHVFTFKKK